MNKNFFNLVSILIIACFITITQVPSSIINAGTSSDNFECNGNVLVKYTGKSKSVTIPNTIKEIGSEAFYGNPYVKSIKLPNNLETLGRASFAYCSALEKISIPNSVIRIDSGAFACNLSLKSVKIGKNVKELGEGIFAGCTSLKNVKFNNNDNFLVKDGAIFDHNEEILYQYLPGSQNSTFKVPQGVIQIKKYAFWGCDKLGSVFLNSHINDISGYAFSNCTSLKEIHIPYSVNLIGPKAFENCLSLEEVYIPPSVYSIHKTAFDGCINLLLKADVGSNIESFVIAYNENQKEEQKHNIENNHENNEQQNVTNTDSTNDSNSNDSNRIENNEDDSSNYGNTKIVGGKAVFMIDKNSTNVYHGNMNETVSYNDSPNIGN